jgi:hypothetical protein
VRVRLTSADATAQDLARLAREHWSTEAHHHVPRRELRRRYPGQPHRPRPASLATIRAAIKDAGYLHIPEGRCDHTTPAETLRLHGLD